MKRTIRLDPEIVNWILKKVGERRFKDETHGVEWAVAFVMEHSAEFGSLEEFERFVREAGPAWIEKHAPRRVTAKPDVPDPPRTRPWKKPGT